MTHEVLNNVLYPFILFSILGLVALYDRQCNLTYIITFIFVIVFSFLVNTRELLMEPFTPIFGLILTIYIPRSLEILVLFNLATIKDSGEKTNSTGTMTKSLLFTDLLLFLVCSVGGLVFIRYF
jgi:hypothetical protein